ncbi:MAG: VIT1/CCC1 transporter family protein [Candidatus Diapherotrites archaeon]
MDHSLKTGFSFGLTSGIITTLGLIVGLHSGTHSEGAVLGGILVIAVADAFSDALGIHVSQESENQHTAKEVWLSTIYTFLSKFIVALTFAVPILFFKDLNTAIIVSVLWGLSLLGLFSFLMARQRKENPWGAAAEHLVIAFAVIIATHFIGDFVGAAFGGTLV